MNTGRSNRRTLADSHVVLLTGLHTNPGPGSSVGIATDYGMNGPGSYPNSVALVVNTDSSKLQAFLPSFICDHYEWLTCDTACGVYCQSDGG